MKHESKAADFTRAGWVCMTIAGFSVANFFVTLSGFPRLKWIVLCAGLSSFALGSVMIAQGNRKSRAQTPEGPEAKTPEAK